MLPLQSIPPVCGTNAGGLVEAVRVWPRANVRRLPTAADEAVDLYDPQNYADLYFPDNGAGFDEPQGEDDQGQFWTPKLQLVLPQDSPTVAEGLRRLRQAGGEFLLAYQDANGYTRLVGTLDWPLRLLDDFSTGSKATEMNGHRLTFSGRTPTPAPFYQLPPPPPATGRAFSAGFTFGYS